MTAIWSCGLAVRESALLIYKVWRMGKNKFIKRWMLVAFCLIIYDILAVNLSYFFVLWARFDLHISLIPYYYIRAWKNFVPVYTIFCIAVFWMQNLYQSLWRYASDSEMIRAFTASIITAVFHSVAITLLFCRMPISYYLFGAMLQFMLVIGIRFSYRFVILEWTRTHPQSDEPPKNVMLIGAGEAGHIILRDIKNAKETTDKVVCIIDDDSNKWHRYIDGVLVVGGRDRILECVEKYNVDKIYLAIPSASATVRRDLLNICQESDCEIQALPGIYQLVNGEVTISAMRKVSMEDLLGRDQIQVNDQEILESLRGKRILITGGGGSIGSELCRQIASHKPGQLLILDIYENNAYDIQQDLKAAYPDLNLVTLIGSVRDSRRINQIFRDYRPQIVFHAAAHKHVPLMEASPCEAVKNNVIGTYKTAYVAMKYGAERFILISTDKAVNPTNIMGASKRLCEMVIQALDRVSREERWTEMPYVHAHVSGPPKAFNKYLRRDVEGNILHTEFVAVRFGNVLGSNGSVIPLFRKQIARGGPVTVTHPDIIRYFMTIPEAVGLVLQAGAYAKGGEIFVLDMGEPVKIDTMARNLIRLSGFIPDVDIKIVYTGLRPGEKLFEEKLMAEEGLERTPNELIHVCKPLDMDLPIFLDQLTGLAEASYENDPDIEEMVRKMVPTYRPQDSKDWNITDERDFLQ